jgi:predicted alpha/beta hydrolase
MEGVRKIDLKSFTWATSVTIGKDAALLTYSVTGEIAGLSSASSKMNAASVWKEGNDWKAASHRRRSEIKRLPH